jgi:hypothetical protein
MRRSRRRRVSSTRAQRAPQNAARSNTGTFPFWSGRDSKPNKSPFPFNVLAALTGTNRGNVEGCSTSQLHPFEGEPTDSRRVSVFCLPSATSVAAGGRSTASRALRSSGRGRLFGFTHPRAGVGLVPPTVCGVGSSESRVVCGKQKWGGRSPAAVRCFDSASKLAHAKRFATSEVPCGHGGTRSTASLGPGGTGPSTES